MGINFNQIAFDENKCIIIIHYIIINHLVDLCLQILYLIVKADSKDSLQSANQHIQVETHEISL